MSNHILGKENSNILRGLAIISIMLHNFLHYGFGFTEENEMDYSQERADAFFHAVNVHETSILGELFSFLGWTGVPVFVFLTGYGLGKKHPSHRWINTFAYLRHQYLKLFFLLLPAILFFVYFDLRSGLLVDAAKKLFVLSMLQNFDYPLLKINPGVYWYFGLTFQLYIVFLFFRKHLKPVILLIFSLLTVFLLGYLGLSDMRDAMSIYRHCITGWFPIFALGIWLSTKEEMLHYKCSLAKSILFSAFFLVVLVIMNVNYYLWLFVPLASLLFFLSFGNIVMRIPFLSGIFKVVGSYSAFIFVCHPIQTIILYF